MSSIDKEALEVVERINAMLYDKLVATLGEKKAESFMHMMYLTFNSNAYDCGISFNDIPIWSHDDDERKYVNEGTPEEDYEPLFDFVLRQLNEMFTIFGQMKLEV